MSQSLVDKMWNDISEQLGEDLRVVARYTPKELDNRMRNDVRDTYSSEEDRKIAHDTIVKQLSFNDTEDLYKVGEFEGLLHIFEEAWVLTWPDSLPGKSGVIISIQRGGASASMDDIDWCVQYLENEIASLIS